MLTDLHALHTIIFKNARKRIEKFLDYDLHIFYFYFQLVASLQMLESLSFIAKRPCWHFIIY